jgi:hypothetical protein
MRCWINSRVWTRLSTGGGVTWAGVDPRFWLCAGERSRLVAVPLSSSSAECMLSSERLSRSKVSSSVVFMNVSENSDIDMSAYLFILQFPDLRRHSERAVLGKLEFELGLLG